ncbi:hypothetical protein EV356DRAFT_500533 [Viridothelium virens]|uniref:LYR motif-containing protein 2 n=1 Tax=Viridothelium virens TaxID=1048519 RepID=A0A6A6HB23_VIRVR|nr:hypothetical protein EV356DRAFT_500533 [Viridothelium virens]
MRFGRLNSSLQARRAYATVQNSRPSRLKSNVVDLDHFLQRQRALALWRDIVRAIRSVPNSSTKYELRRYARAEFERNKQVTDIAHIRYLISTGKTEFDGMKRYIEEQAQ